MAISFSLFTNMDLSTSWARARRGRAATAACPAANSIAARVVMSHRGDEIDAEADLETECSGETRGRQCHAAACQAAAELVARPGQSAADRAGRPPEPVRRFVERQSLEVAEHDRQAKWPGQAVDLVMENLGLLAGQDRLFGGRAHRLDLQ